MPRHTPTDFPDAPGPQSRDVPQSPGIPQGSGVPEHAGVLRGNAAAIGHRIRALRTERGVSLSALARRAGIGKATLSGLETGARNPTLETLYAVTGQLGVPLAAVLDPPASGNPPGHPGGDQAAPMVIRGAAVEGMLLDVFSDPGATYELYRIRIRAGATQTSPAHPAGVTEHVTVFRGELTAGPLDAPLRATAAGYLSWVADVPHTYAAGGEDVEASLLIRSPRLAPDPD